MVGNNTPVFFIRDPTKFPDFIHTQKRHPGTNLKDADMFWDFLSLTPESIHQLTILFSDRGNVLGGVCVCRAREPTATTAVSCRDSDPSTTCSAP